MMLHNPTGNSPESTQMAVKLGWYISTVKYSAAIKSECAILKAMLDEKANRKRM